MLFFFKSTLLKTIPEFGEDGKISSLTFNPEWIPIPSTDIYFEIVFCVKIDIESLYKRSKIRDIQLLLQQNTIILRKTWKISQKNLLY